MTIIQGKGTLPREQAGRNIHYDDASLANYKKVEQGDFIIHLRSFEGGLEMANEDGIVSPAYTILRCKKAHSSLFYEAYFHTDEFINHILSKSVEGIRDGRQISYEAFKWLGLPYCDVSEQEKIARLFSALSHRIEKQQQMVDALKKYKRGVLSVAFGKYGSICSWQTTPYPFAELASRRSEKYDPRSGEQMPCVELEHIEQETGRIIGSIPSTQQNSIKGVCKSGDTLFGKLRPYLRKYAFVKKDMVCSSEIWSLVPSETIIPEYLFYLVQTDEFIKIANISSGTKMPRAEWSNIEKSVFSVPNKEVQAQIVQTLRGLDSRMLDAIDMLGELQLMKEGLLQQLFI
mgnify:CR=1 FL=1